MRTKSTLTGTASLVKHEPPHPTFNHRGDWKLYKLFPPLEGHDQVVVSSIEEPFDTLKPETYIFPGKLTDEGLIRITDYKELTGSFRGEQNHEKALNIAGYEVVNG